jgi:glycine/D-amino acid oxidase-like deaminating enzyme/nitrite reductase/ring-hydroxylating ferredoxin subunit
MDRDGANISLWQNELENYLPADISPREMYDVVIVGGGITGVSTSELLQRNGLSCLLAEAQTLGFGTTSGTTAHLNTLLDLSYSDLEKKFGEEKAKLVLKATREAISFVEENVTKYGLDADFSRKQGFLFSQNNDQTEELKNIYDASLMAGCEVDYADEIPIPLPFIKALEFGDQGQIHPVKYIFGLAKQFEQSGGHILQQCRVSKVDEKNGLLEIETSKGLIKARHLIYATHIPPGVNLLHFKCAPYRTYAVACILDKDDYPDSLVYDMYDPYHYYRTHEINGRKFLIAGGNDHKTAEEPNTDQCFTVLEAYLRKHFAIKEIAFKWSSQFFEPVDGLPYIGHLPGNPSNVYVATGYGGNGITFSQVAAKLLTDMVLDKKNEFEELFNPARVKPVAGFSNFIKDAADVVAHLISAPFEGEKIQEITEIAPGEARVIVFEKNKLAIYKDSNGKVYSLNPACTHIKCLVAFNKTEKAWECPCHGSRFSIEGEMLTGPARKDLEKINLQF